MKNLGAKELLIIGGGIAIVSFAARTGKGASGLFDAIATSIRDPFGLKSDSEKEREKEQQLAIEQTSTFSNINGRLAAQANLELNAFKWGGLACYYIEEIFAQIENFQDFSNVYLQAYGESITQAMNKTRMNSQEIARAFKVGTSNRFRTSSLVVEGYEKVGNRIEKIPVHFSGTQRKNGQILRVTGFFSPCGNPVCLGFRINAKDVFVDIDMLNPA